MKIKTKTLRRAGGGLVLLAVGVALWLHFFHRYTPIEVAEDIRAGMMSEHATRPAERFLEIRYGPLTEPANRRRAFLDFFNAGHIEGLHVLTTHMQAEQQRTNILAMAQWLAEYRGAMSPKEKQTLNAYFDSADGRETLRRATAQYMQQDAYYRGATAPVIAELMTTLAAIQQH